MRIAGFVIIVIMNAFRATPFFNDATFCSSFICFAFFFLFDDFKDQGLVTIPFCFPYTISCAMKSYKAGHEGRDT